MIGISISAGIRLGLLLLVPTLQLLPGVAQSLGKVVVDGGFSLGEYRDVRG